jgi:hypothetical protein
MNVPPLPRTPGGTRRFFDAYTQGLSTTGVERLFTREAPEAYRFFLRAVDVGALRALPWHRRLLAHIRLFFLASTLKLSPARRAIYAVALAAALVGLVKLFHDLRCDARPGIGAAGVRQCRPEPAAAAARGGRVRTAARRRRRARHVRARVRYGGTGTAGIR